MKNNLFLFVILISTISQMVYSTKIIDFFSYTHNPSQPSRLWSNPTTSEKTGIIKNKISEKADIVGIVVENGMIKENESVLKNQQNYENIYKDLTCFMGGKGTQESTKEIVDKHAERFIKEVTSTRKLKDMIKPIMALLFKVGNKNRQLVFFEKKSCGDLSTLKPTLKELIDMTEDDDTDYFKKVKGSNNLDFDDTISEWFGHEGDLLTHAGDSIIPTKKRKKDLTDTEKENLQLKGFSINEINQAIASMQTKPPFTYDNIYRALDTKKDTRGIHNLINCAYNQTTGTINCLNFAVQLKESAQRYEREAQSKHLQHYFSMFPDRSVIQGIVEKWPDKLKDKAEIISRQWPEIYIAESKVDFRAIQSPWRNNYRPEESTIGLIPFFKFIKDLTFHAVNKKDPLLVDRLAHIMIGFSQHTLDNTHEGRLARYLGVINAELERGISSTRDIGALAFLCSTDPETWDSNQHEIRHCLTQRAINRSDNYDFLTNGYSHWLKNETREDFVESVETNLMGDVTFINAFLDSFVRYLNENKSEARYSRSNNKPLREEIGSSKYFNSVSGLLKKEFTLPRWDRSNPITEEVLAEFYSAPQNQHMLLGTEAYKVYQEKERKNKVNKKLNSILTLYTSNKDSEERASIKKAFSELGSSRATDSDGDIYYGKYFYDERKKLSIWLGSMKKLVAKIIGIPITFKASMDQLNTLLETFENLPIQEQRYWKMSRAYVDAVAIPDLASELNFGEEAVDQEDLVNKDKNVFVTCKCSECTLCKTSRFNCQCQKGLKDRLGHAEMNRRDKYLLNKTGAALKKHFDDNYCTEHTPDNLEENIDQPSLNDKLVNEKRRIRKRLYQKDSSAESVINEDETDRKLHVDTIKNQQAICSKHHYPICMRDKFERETVDIVKQGIHDKHDKRHSRAPTPLNYYRKFEECGFKCKSCPKHVTNPHESTIAKRTRQEKWICNTCDTALFRRSGFSCSAAACPEYFKSADQLKMHKDIHQGQWHCNGCNETLNTEEALRRHKRKQHALDSHQQAATTLYNIDTSPYGHDTFEAIKCDEQYIDFERLQKHLAKLATGKKGKIALTNESKTESHLHKLLCMACRTVFGQHRELKAHIEDTHQKQLDDALTKIKAMDNSEQPENNPSYDNPEEYIHSANNKELAKAKVAIGKKQSETETEEMLKDIKI